MAVKHSLYHETGKLSVDMEQCTLCGVCVKTCPAEVLQIEDEALQQVDAGFGCIACGHCMMVCQQECITVSGRNLSPEDLQPLPPQNARADAESLQALLTARRSVRRFNDQPVAPEQIEQIIAMASTAPMGIPPWDVGVVTINGFDAVRELAGEVVEGYRGMLKIFRPGMLKLMRPFMGQARFDQFSDFIVPLAHNYIESWDEGRDTVFWGAPAVLIFHYSAYAGEPDAVIACTYAMLAAESLGLGSCVIGGAPPVLQRNKALCAKLGIPQGNKLALALVLGSSAVPFKRGIVRRFSHEQGAGLQ
jgi:nitroreductase/NAD-dependent dihydropyrimidine dehydrogenase PreA subunit